MRPGGDRLLEPRAARHQQPPSLFASGITRPIAARKYTDLQVEASLQRSIYSYATAMNGLADEAALRLRFDRGGRLPAARGLALPGLPGAEPVLGVGVAGGRARRPEDVPARFTLYRFADNGPRG